MRPAEIDTAEIIRAGNELVEGGRNVTGFALRQKVGGGNPNRLKQVWEEHVSTQRVVTAEPVAELPHEVAEQLKTETALLSARLAGLAVDLNDRAVKAAERRVAEVLRSAGEQREQAERELADASTTVEDLEKNLDAANEQIKALTLKVEGQGEGLQSQKVEIAQLKSQLEAANQAALKAAAVAAEREENLTSQLAESQKSEQASREREAQAVGQVAAAQKQHEEDSRVCAALRGEIDVLKTKMADQAVSLATTQARLDDSSAALVKSESRAGEAEKVRAAALAEAAVHAGEIKQLKEQISEMKIAHKERISELEKPLEGDKK